MDKGARGAPAPRWATTPLRWRMRHSLAVVSIKRWPSHNDVTLMQTSHGNGSNNIYTALSPVLVWRFLYM